MDDDTQKELVDDRANGSCCLVWWYSENSDDRTFIVATIFVLLIRTRISGIMKELRIVNSMSGSIGRDEGSLSGRAVLRNQTAD